MADLKLDYACQLKSNTPLTLPQHLLMGAGPVNIAKQVREALAFEGMIPIAPPLLQMMDRIKVMLQYLFQTQNTLTLAIQASGNGGNEAIITNLVDPGETVLVAIGGFWGEKVVDMAKRRRANVVALRKEPGEVFSLAELKEGIIKHKPVLLFVTHGESTGGTIQRLEGLGELCHEYDCLLAVDGIVSIGVEPFFMDRWKIDVVTAASQKAIGAPPGLCMMSFSPRAEKILFSKKEPSPYYLDVKALGGYWNCFEKRLAYHYTYCTNLLAAVHEALNIICEEGLDNMWERHQSVSEIFWKELEDLGFECSIRKIENRFHGVTVITLPDGIESPKLLDYIEQKYDLIINPGLGTFGPRSVRVGLLGINCTNARASFVIHAFKDALSYLNKQN